MIVLVIPFNKHAQLEDNRSGCHPERPKGVEGSWHEFDCKCNRNAKILRLRYAYSKVRLPPAIVYPDSLRYAQDDTFLLCAFCLSCLQKVITTMIVYSTTISADCRGGSLTLPLILQSKISSPKAKNDYFPGGNSQLHSETTTYRIICRPAVCQDLSPALRRRAYPAA